MSVQPGEILTVHRCKGGTGRGPKLGCGKPIAFRLTRSGAKMPIDPVPSPKGSIALIGAEGQEIAEVLTGERGDSYEGFLYTPHFETCVDAAEFKKPKPTDAEKKAEEQIRAHAVWFVHECREKGKTTREQVGALFMERQPKWWRDERNRAARKEWIQRVREQVLEEMGFREVAA